MLTRRRWLTLVSIEGGGDCNCDCDMEWASSGARSGWNDTALTANDRAVVNATTIPSRCKWSHLKTKTKRGSHAWWGFIRSRDSWGGRCNCGHKTLHPPKFVVEKNAATFLRFDSIQRRACILFCLGINSKCLTTTKTSKQNEFEINQFEYLFWICFFCLFACLHYNYYHWRRKTKSIWKDMRILKCHLNLLFFSFLFFLPQLFFFWWWTFNPLPNSKKSLLATSHHQQRQRQRTNLPTLIVHPQSTQYLNITFQTITNYECEKNDTQLILGFFH